MIMMGEPKASSKERPNARIPVTCLILFAFLRPHPGASFRLLAPSARRRSEGCLQATTTTRRHWCLDSADEDLVDSYSGREHRDLQHQQKHDRQRRQLLHTMIAASLPWFATGLGRSADAAETVGKDPNCSDAACLGVWDGLLADCPHPMASVRSGAGCVSSQDDTPGNFAEPWDYSETVDVLDWRPQMDRLVTAIQLVSASRGEQFGVQLREGRYLRGIFADSVSQETSVGEFYFTPDDTTVQFRIASASSRGVASALFAPSSLRNIDRAENIRKAMGYLKLPVLRNRRRTLFFGESDLDTFGPGSAALGPPAEMTTGELEGRIYVP
jgi:hypothetical protein